MAAGDILKEALLIIQEQTVKVNEDIEKGEIVINDGAGILAAVAGTIGSFMMALESHDYSEVSTHKVKCVKVGCVTVQKVAVTGGGKKGQPVMISATAGEVTLFVKGDAPAGGDTTYYTATIEAGVQTALDKNLGIVGVLNEDAADADLTAKIWIGVK